MTEYKLLGYNWYQEKSEFLDKLKEYSVEGWRVICVIQDGVILLGREVTPPTTVHGKSISDDDELDFLK